MKCKACEKELPEKATDATLKKYRDSGFCNQFCAKFYSLDLSLTEMERKSIESKKKVKIQIIDQREILFGKRYKDCTFINYRRASEAQEKMVQQVVELTNIMKKSGKIIAFVGGCGTGKDHIAAAMTHYLPGQKIHTTVMKMSRAMRDAGGLKTQQQVIDEYKKPDFLIINEIGVQSVTSFEHNILHEIIDHHYRYMTSVLLISNHGKEDFQKCIDAPGIYRIWDRIDQVIIFDWESYRK